MLERREGRWMARPMGRLAARAPELVVYLVGVPLLWLYMISPTLFGDLSRWSALLAVLVAMDLLAMILLPFQIRKRAARRVAQRVMEQDDEGHHAYVQIEVRSADGRWCGADRGALWTEGSKIHFAGEACSFSLGRAEVRKLNGLSILLHGGSKVDVQVLYDPTIGAEHRLFRWMGQVMPVGHGEFFMAMKRTDGGIWNSMFLALEAVDDGEPSQLPPTSGYRGMAIDY